MQPRAGAKASYFGQGVKEQEARPETLSDRDFEIFVQYSQSSNLFRFLE